MSKFHIRHAEMDDLRNIASLFDQYRMFYGQPSNPGQATSFIRERLVAHQSIVFLAESDHDHKAIGFVQMYPSFCSIEAKPIWILYDLFVLPTARKLGVGRALMERARQHAEQTRAAKIVLSTATSNHEAQRLYESLGYARDNVFVAYSLDV